MKVHKILKGLLVFSCFSQNILNVFRHTDQHQPSNAIIFLKADLNSFLCLYLRSASSNSQYHSLLLKLGLNVLKFINFQTLIFRL